MTGVKRIAMFILMAMTLSCALGKSPYRGVTGYQNGQVFLFNKTSYRVGTLPEGWERLSTKAQAIAFYHHDFQSTIFTDAFCDEQFEDMAHEVLIGRLVGGLEKLKLQDEKKMPIDKRGALQKNYRAELDGVPIEISALLLKKEECLFDFVAIMPPGMKKQVQPDFERFYKGFSY